MLYNTTNGQAHNNSTTICHIAMPEPNISTCQDVGMWQIFVRVIGEFVVQQVVELL